jgi:uncharacterized protein YbjT (DUF2867 family)
VFVVGGTVRTGGRVLQQLVSRGVRVRAIVRSVGKVPAPISEHPNVTLIEADLERHVHGCDAVVPCLGHVMSVRGCSVRRSIW